MLLAKPVVMIRLAQQEPRPRLGSAVALGLLLACASPPPAREAPPPTPKSVRPTPGPAPESVPYVVRAGESLGDIARCSGTSVADLARSNAIQDPDRVYAGETLRLPARHRCDQRKPSDAAAPARARAGVLLAQARADLDAADFETALARAGECAEKLAVYPRDAKANALRARCHVVAGTAATGLDRPERAIEEFRRALALHPQLDLASETTSPRVLELMALARSGSSR